MNCRLESLDDQSCVIRPSKRPKRVLPRCDVQPRSACAIKKKVAQFDNPVNAMAPILEVAIVSKLCRQDIYKQDESTYPEEIFSSPNFASEDPWTGANMFESGQRGLRGR
jgi:hypothetical protein